MSWPAGRSIIIIYGTLQSFQICCFYEKKVFLFFPQWLSYFLMCDYVVRNLPIKFNTISDI